MVHSAYGARGSWAEAGYSKAGLFQAFDFPLLGT